MTPLGRRWGRKKSSSSNGNRTQRVGPMGGTAAGSWSQILPHLIQKEIRGKEAS